MGHRKKHAPKRGSLSYSPRKRAGALLARTRHWPKIRAETPALLGFIGYKAGMTHVFSVEERKRSPNYGKEIIRAATVLETPQMVACAVRAYRETSNVLRTLTETWMQDPPAELGRLLTLPDKFDTEENMKKIEENLEQISRLRILAATQPERACVPRKKPEIAEIEVCGGSMQQQFSMAKSILGKSIYVADVFKEGQYVDALAVTIGKGFQGPVKRWGVRILHHKARKTKRGIATLGPWKPTHLMHSIPRAGQMGFHQRTERNKRILKIGLEGKEVTPKGGFVRYGVLQGAYMILDGSIPGPEKRPIKIRHSARPPRGHSQQPSPQITYVSLESSQGK